MFGQNARALAPGAVEAGLSAGAVFTREGGSHTDGSSAAGSGGSTVIQLPNLDGNLSVGLSDSIAFNVHGGPAGIQPGFKINLLRDDWSIAAQPQLGFGLLRVSGSGMNGDDNTLILFNAGAKLMLSEAETGLSFGAGYTFEYVTNSSTTQALPGMSASSSSSSQEHELVFGFGLEGRSGVVLLRPEINVLIIPARSSSSESSGSTRNTTGDLSWAVLPTLTIALESAPLRSN